MHFKHQSTEGFESEQTDNDSVPKTAHNCESTPSKYHLHDKNVLSYTPASVLCASAPTQIQTDLTAGLTNAIQPKTPVKASWPHLQAVNIACVLGGTLPFALVFGQQSKRTNA
jgi:hypothetical protein